MSAGGVVEDVLLVVGCAVLLGAVLGLLLVDGFYDRLHFVGLATTLGVPPVVAALAIAADGVAATLKVVVIGVLLVGTGPAVTAATARAGVVRERDGAGGPS